MARGRLPEPESVTAAKREFVAASDAVRSWLDETCTRDPDAWAPRTELYESYTKTADDSGSKRLSAREFYQRIEQIGGITARPRQGQRGFSGVRKRAPWEDMADNKPDKPGAEGAGSPTPTRLHGKKGAKPAPSAPQPESPPTSGSGAPRCGCGNELMAPASIERGRCERCHLAGVSA